MCQLALQHHYARRCVVTVAVLVAGALHAHGVALASCGDYLMHGALHHSAGSHDAQRRETAHLDDALFTADSSQGAARPAEHPQPVSPCASGRCHSLPVWPPLSHPTRMMIAKHGVAVALWLCSHRDAAPLNWGFPSDGVLPQVPALGPESPPPRAVFFQA